MAGDWIKVESVTPEKPEVDMMAEALKLPPDQIVGILIRIWIWADQQTITGNAPSVTKKTLNRHARVPGFATAMENAGWLVQTGHGITFPRFERHNGKTAKRRALTTKRVQTHRNESGNAPSVTGALPEKRREEPTPPAPPSGGGGGGLFDRMKIPKSCRDRRADLVLAAYWSAASDPKVRFPGRCVPHRLDDKAELTPEALCGLVKNRIVHKIDGDFIDHEDIGHNHNGLCCMSTREVLVPAAHFEEAEYS
jgi:hypothetical protein